MKKIIYCVVFVLTSISCSTNQTSEKEDVKLCLDKSDISLFYDSTLNLELKKYLKYSRNAFKGDKIHVVSFESDGVVKFTGLLCIEKENLVGYVDYKEDIILVYDNKEVARKYLDINLLKTDSVTRFPYFEDVDNLYPFDPPSIKLDLTNYKGKF